MLRNVTSIESALMIENRTPTIGMILRAYDFEKVEALLKLWLVDLNESLSLKNPMSENQIDDASMLILSSYKQLTMTDIMLIFRNAKTGVYGKFYERIGLQDVMTWFREYFDERADTAAVISLNEHLEKKVVDNHHNKSKDEGYRKFKNTQTIKEILKNGDKPPKTM